jgi:hypothetical protein
VMKSTLEQNSPLPERALVLRVQEALKLFQPSERRQVFPQILRDLRLLYAVRNGMAHSGHFEMEISLAHYLFNLGIELVKAAMSEMISAAKNQEHEARRGLDDIWRACHDFAVGSAPHPGNAA